MKRQARRSLLRAFQREAGRGIRQYTRRPQYSSRLPSAEVKNVLHSRRAYAAAWKVLQSGRAFSSTRDPGEMLRRLQNGDLRKTEVEELIRANSALEEEMRFKPARPSAGQYQHHQQQNISGAYQDPQAGGQPGYAPPQNPYGQSGQQSFGAQAQQHGADPRFAAQFAQPEAAEPRFSVPGITKNRPVYIQKVNEGRFASMLGSILFWVVIIGLYYYFQKQSMNMRMGGLESMMGGDNNNEFDEIHWKDEEDEKTAKAQESSTLKYNQEDSELDEFDKKQLKWRERMGFKVDKSREDGEPEEEEGSGKGGGRKKVLHKRTRFTEICGNTEAKIDLKDLVDYLSNPEKYKKMGCKLPKGVLLEGPPGTGKTLMARALAGEAGVPFLSTSGSNFDQIFVGVGVLRVKNLFKRAKELAPCIIFIDEIDAIGSARSGFGMNAHSSDSLNALLVELDGFEDNNGVVVIGATNMAQRLDQALTRSGRFDRKVRVGLPDRDARKDIVDLYLKDRGAEDVDTAKLVSGMQGASGADLANLVNIAAIEAVKGDQDNITMHNLVEAAEIIAMGRPQESFNKLMTQQEKELTAHHEAGHAIMALYTKGSKPIYKATLLPRGEALGMVSFTESDGIMQTKESMLADMAVAMGGRAAEEMMYGLENVTTGAAGDFNSATRTANAMVTRAGFSEKVGKVYYTPDEVEKLSPEMQDLIQAEIRRLSDQSYEQATTLLKQHKGELMKLANALLERETLTAPEIKELLNYDSSQASSPVDDQKSWWAASSHAFSWRRERQEASGRDRRDGGGWNWPRPGGGGSMGQMSFMPTEHPRPNPSPAAT